MKQERGILLSCMMAQAVWLGVWLTLELVFCLIAYRADDPDRMILPLSLCAQALAGIFCGIAAVRLSGDGIASGALAGLISAVLTYAVSCLPLPQTSADVPMSFLLNALLIPAAVIGSILGHKRENRAAGRQRKIRKASRG